MTFKQDSLTFWVAKRLKSLFSAYFIDSRSDIMVNDILDEKHPMHVYFSLLRPNINFNFRKTNIKNIVGRVHYYFTGRTVANKKFTTVWKFILQKQVCPWITKQVDYAI